MEAIAYFRTHFTILTITKKPTAPATSTPTALKVVVAVVTMVEASGTSASADRDTIPAPKTPYFLINFMLFRSFVLPDSPSARKQLPPDQTAANTNTMTLAEFFACGQ